ncbi:MAG: HAMP domain-containing protein [Anaerolineae bacterium]|nr:HAMP domain-containing protein [Anaerolineae bacterium]MCA9891654.1 HAMP domain-containing protein [Anaerolineae bacterium]
MIGRRFAYGFVVLLLFFFAQGILYSSLTQQVTQSFGEITTTVSPSLILIGQIKTQANTMIAEAVSASLLIQTSNEHDIELDDIELAAIEELEENSSEENGEAGEEDVEGEIAQFFYAYTEAQTLLENLGELHTDEHVSELQSAIDVLYDQSRDLIQMTIYAAPGEDIIEQKELMEISEDIIGDYLAELTAEEQTLLTTLEDTAHSTSDIVLSLSISSLILTLIMMIGAYYLVRRGMINPLTRLQQTATQIAAGRYDLRTTEKSPGEIGDLERSFNTMLGVIDQRNVLLAKSNEELAISVKDAEAARDKAEHADRVKSSFLASMSHELRTPLNAIINFSKFVAQGDLGPVNEEQKETLDEVVDSARHLLNLINDVLDMSKIESDSLNLFIQDNVDISEILVGAAKTVSSLVAEKPVEIKVDIQPNMPNIAVDRQRLRQIIINLLGNATKFTEEGTVTLSAHIEGEEVLISVRDTGVGIAPEDHEAVFEAFKQTESGIRQGGGTGLGLPITKNLVNLHGGHIWLESALGEGTTFNIVLPIKASQPTENIVAMAS